MILAKVRRKSSSNRMKTRSSHQMCSLREGVLRNFAKFTGKHLCQSLQAEACNFIKKETLAQVFSFEFCEFSKNTFFTEHLWATASGKLSQVNIGIPIPCTIQ